MSALLESLLTPEQRLAAVTADEKQALCAPLVVNVPSVKLTEHELMATRIRALIEDFTALQSHYDASIYDVLDSLGDALVHWKATYPLTAEDKAEQYHDAREGE